MFAFETVYVRETKLQKNGNVPIVPLATIYAPLTSARFSARFPEYSETNVKMNRLIFFFNESLISSFDGLFSFSRVALARYWLVFLNQNCFFFHPNNRNEYDDGRFFVETLFSKIFTSLKTQNQTSVRKKNPKNVKLFSHSLQNNLHVQGTFQNISQI